MNKLIIALYIGFVVLLFLAIRTAFTYNDGLISDDYYETSDHYFQNQQIAEQNQFQVRLPEAMSMASHVVTVSVSDKDGAMTHARLTLHYGLVAKQYRDRKTTMQPALPGIYQASLSFPEKGMWWFLLTVESEKGVRYQKQWFQNIQGVNHAHRTACNVQNAPCERILESGRMVFDVAPRPLRAMKELTFSVHCDGMSLNADNLRVSLTMPGMNMGTNQVFLKEDNKGGFSGKGMVVSCRSGHTLWQAELLSGNVSLMKCLFNVLVR